MGEVFTWGKSLIYFTDSDSNSDALDTAYHHTDHSVWLSFSSTTPTNQFDHVKWIGLLFGQAFSTNIGVKSFPYQYQDPYSFNSIPTATFSITIN